MKNQSIIVLKFGSSILHRAKDFVVAAEEIQRFHDCGQRVIAVVSAMNGETSRLLQSGRTITQSESSSQLAELVGTGEQQSALLLAMALGEIRISSNIAAPEDIGLSAEGSVLNADLVDVDNVALETKLSFCSVLVVPGFVGVDNDGSRKLLGRGGSDLTAVFLANQLGAECVLVKDVDGIFDRDPAICGSSARKFEKIGWDDALDVAGELVQPKAIRYARKHNFNFEVASLGSETGTLVGPTTVWPSADVSFRKPAVAIS